MHYLYPDPPSMWPMIWPELVKGFPAAIVALLVAFIAWRQYRVARAKFDLDLFQQRYRVYEVLAARISSECEFRGSQDDDRFFVNEWKSLADRALFLFGPDMKLFVEGVLITGQEIDYLHAEIDSGLSEGSRVRVESELNQKRVTMNFLRRRVHVEFSPFMDFSKWKR